MVLFISGALFGLILGLTLSAYVAGVFGIGRGAGSSPPRNLDPVKNLERAFRD